MYIREPSIQHGEEGKSGLWKLMLPPMLEMLQATSPSDKCENRTITMEVSNMLR